MRYMVRTEPGAVDAVYADLEEVMRELNPDRVITIRTLTRSRPRTFRHSSA